MTIGCPSTVDDYTGSLINDSLSLQQLLESLNRKDDDLRWND